MKRFTLNQALVLTVVATLLPISLLSVLQRVENLDYAEKLIREQLVSSAFATAAGEREPILLAQRTLTLLSRDPDVVSATPRCNAALRDALGDQRTFINMIRLDSRGEILCSVLPVPEGRPVTYSNEGWWQRGIKGRRFSLSGPVIGKVSGKPVIVAMVPMYDKAGKSIGSISTGISMNWIRESLRRQKLEADAVAAIADEQGKILFSSGPVLLSSVDVEKTQAKTRDTTDRTGQKWTYATAPLFERQLFVVYAERKPSFISSSIVNFRAGLFLPLLAILLTSFAVWLGVRRLVIRWLTELASLADQIAKGNHDGDPDQFAKAPAELASLGADLQRMSATIAARNEALELASQQAHAMSREVNHRVKNNLQLVMSLLGLQSAQVRDMAARLALEQTRARMGALALVHRLLYEEDAQADVGRVDADRLLSELCSQLRGGLGHTGRVELQLSATVGVVSVDQAIPIALFAVEAVGNSYRHAFVDTGHGKILITHSRDDDQLSLSIVDNGIGFDTDKHSASIGLELMKGFASQLNGLLSFENCVPAGLAVVLIYPHETFGGVKSGVTG